MRGASIFRYSLMLAVGSAMVLACASIGVILLNPPPFYFTISTFEVARVLRGQPITPRQDHLQRVVLTTAPTAGRPPDAYAKILRDALARQLDASPESVTFETLIDDSMLGDPALDAARRSYQSLAAEAARTYGADVRFSPLIFGPFRAILALGDGRWVVVSRTGPNAGPQWQVGLAGLIAFALILQVPFAWLFSNRLAKPIRAFASAADRIGSGGFEHVDVKGPSEIRVAAGALNEMQVRIARSVEERTFVIGAMAHDLRTPLSRLAFLLAAAPPEMRARTDSEIAGMESMIATTLDFVQSESAAPPQQERIDLRLLIEGVIDNFADSGAAASMAPGASAIVLGDPHLLTRLFTNLVSNALTYGETARASLQLESEGALVEIADNGPGMSESDIARAFEPFFRAEPSRSMRTGGMGLGLTIARSLARAHGGSVTLENAPHGGLIAKVRLPDWQRHLNNATSPPS